MTLYTMSWSAGAEAALPYQRALRSGNGNDDVAHAHTFIEELAVHRQKLPPDYLPVQCPRTVTGLGWLRLGSETGAISLTVRRGAGLRLTDIKNSVQLLT